MSQVFILFDVRLGEFDAEGGKRLGVFTIQYRIPDAKVQSRIDPSNCKDVI
jgi:hypothetical protein